MATKVNLMKLLQEMRGLSELNQPHFTGKPPALVLAQFRPQPRGSRTLKRRVIVTVYPQDMTNVPDSVPITFLTAAKPVRQ